MSKLFTPLGAIKHWTEKDPNRLMLTFVSIINDEFVEENRTAKQLLENSLKLASALEKAGLEEGDRFVIVMRNHPEFVEAMLASEILGTVFVPIDIRIQPERLAYMVHHTESRGAIVSTEGLSNMAELQIWPETLEWTWVIDGEPEELNNNVSSLKSQLQAVDEKEALSREVQPRPFDDTMQMLFTSGTTGDPKAIQSTYERFSTVGAVYPILGITPEDRPYTGLSLSHANAQLISLGYSFALGLPLVISRTFTKSRLWDIVSHYKCTTFNLLGGMATALFSEPEKSTDKDHHVRFVLSAGMPATMWEDFEKRFNLKIFEFYGTAEGGLTFNPPGVGPIGSIGQPPPGTICEILDEKDEPCAPYEVGEICFRNESGDVDPVTYFKDPKSSKEKTAGNWFRSGDCGYKDEKGWFYFSYRKGGAVRRSGEFINVNDMVTALAKHSQINDAYVYGVSLESNAPGEKTVIATIILHETEQLVVDRFLSELEEVFGQGAYPDYFQVLDEIPKTPSERPIERYLIKYLNAGKGIIFSRSGEIVSHIDTSKSKTN